MPDGPSGVRDYGDLLAEELRRHQLDARPQWLFSDGVACLPALWSAVCLLRAGGRVQPGSVVVWNYSVFAHAFRGIPMPGVFFGVLLRARGVRVITVLHELAYPWGRRGAAGRIFAVTQRAALIPVLAGSTAVVVTTEQRGAAVRKWTGAVLRPPVHVVPVFSTIGESAAPSPTDGVCRLGVIGYGSDGAQPGLLFAALHYMRPAATLRVVLLGAPGRQSREGKRWMRLARAEGLDDAVEFTGPVSPAELSARLGACDVITLLDEEGPSSRRTMLAAALAHGKATVVTDGPNRWDGPVHAGAIVAVPPEPAELGRVLQRLFGSAEERASIGARARDYYQREMSIEHAANVMCTIICTVTPESTCPVDSSPSST